MRCDAMRLISGSGAVSRCLLTSKRETHDLREGKRTQKRYAGSETEGASAKDASDFVCERASEPRNDARRLNVEPLVATLGR